MVTPKPSATLARSSHPAQIYHERTEHHLHRYAPGPETLDWDTQPSAFRSYAGSPLYELPLVQEAAKRLGPGLLAYLTYAAPDSAPIPTPKPPALGNLNALGALFGLSLGVTAWKVIGTERWAVRANPSSGNLHPVETYLLTEGGLGLPAGVYHYRPQDHQLELRATWSERSQPKTFIALSSVPWREAWKYGERAFRYCQLDVGHAMAALQLAASALGWSLSEMPQIGSLSLAHTLGLDRSEDFPQSKRPVSELEEAEVLLSLTLSRFAPRAWSGEPFGGQSQEARFLGHANRIDPHPNYSWPVLETIIDKTRAADNAADFASQETALGLRATAEAGRSLMQVVLGRRSAQRFDAQTVQPRASFERMLDTLALASAGSPVDGPDFEFLLWVHRVEGLASGVYHCSGVQGATVLLTHLRTRFELEPVANRSATQHRLTRVAALPSKRLGPQARTLHCHQEIAASSCFSVGMFVDFARLTRLPGYAYRRMLRRAGQIGHSLYLSAELEGLRGTAIGCFFDSAVREIVGLQATELRSVYHFSVGNGLADARVQLEAAYQRSQPAPRQP